MYRDNDVAAKDRFERENFMMEIIAQENKAICGWNRYSSRG